MRIEGIDEITYGVEDFDTCKRFFSDWGLELSSEQDGEVIYSTLNNCRIRLIAADAPGRAPAIEAGPTLREVVWGVTSPAVLDELARSLAAEPGFERTADRVWCVDPGGMVIGFQISRKKPVEIVSGQFNTWSDRRRRNERAVFYERAYPVEVGHVVFFVKDVRAMEAFYTDKVGFVASDRYPGRGVFMRCDVQGGHHDMFLLQTPDAKVGLNHVAFTVRDIHEVFGGGLHIDRCGWQTQLGPGRHPISSAYFWYFQNPAGGLIEYYSDDDELDEDWEPREFEPSPTRFAEWGIEGGIDGNTRRQKQAAKAVDGKFLTDKR